MGLATRVRQLFVSVYEFEVLKFFVVARFHGTKK